MRRSGTHGSAFVRMGCFHNLLKTIALATGLLVVAPMSLFASGCEPGATLILRNTTDDQLYVRDTIGTADGIEPGETLKTVIFAPSRRVARIKAHAYRAALGPTDGNAQSDAAKIAANGAKGMDESNLVFCRDYVIDGPSARVEVVIVAGDIACAGTDPVNRAATRAAAR